MSFKTAFPDFKPENMPAIPASWRDVSWKNETCPCWQDTKTGLFIHVDYLEPDLREFPESKDRFNVLCVNDDNGEVETVHSGNCWPSVLACVALYQTSPKQTGIPSTIELARAFGLEIRQTVTGEDWINMIYDNRNEKGDEDLPARDICHSHDYCDANMCMLSAFEKTFGRQPSFLESPEDMKDANVWNDAWQIAKAAEFFASTFMAP